MAGQLPAAGAGRRVPGVHGKGRASRPGRRRSPRRRRPARPGILGRPIPGVDRPRPARPGSQKATSNRASSTAARFQSTRTVPPSRMQRLSLRTSQCGSASPASGADTAAACRTGPGSCSQPASHRPTAKNGTGSARTASQSRPGVAPPPSVGSPSGGGQAATPRRASSTASTRELVHGGGQMAAERSSRTRSGRSPSAQASTSGTNGRPASASYTRCSWRSLRRGVVDGTLGEDRTPVSEDGHHARRSPARGRAEGHCRGRRSRGGLRLRRRVGQGHPAGTSLPGGRRTACRPRRSREAASSRWPASVARRRAHATRIAPARTTTCGRPPTGWSPKRRTTSTTGCSGNRWRGPLPSSDRS